ncbi:MAG: phosphate ABC transporter permease PstA [Oscillospiraceae bacterium]|jgi:phosphate transport system permease protein|nr:phosphate ABC transporter permease PstA [Oscillospiraceae bacterium]
MSGKSAFFKKKKPSDWARFIAVWGAGMLTVSVLVYFIGFILVKGVPNLSAGLFVFDDPKQLSLLPPLIDTLILVGFTLLITAPFGVFTAIYLVEYASRGSRLVRIIRVTTETLAGIPSIVFGLFGYIFFVGWLGWGKSVLAGGFTLAVMILPLIIRTTEESLKSIPDSFREGAFALGAGRLRTVLRVILPSAVQGIFAGVILSVGRIVGETAALIYTIGSVFDHPVSLASPARTLALHVFTLAAEGFHREQAYATAVVLLIIVIGINFLSSFAERRFTKSLNR